LPREKYINTKQLRVYVGCSLNNATKEYRDDVTAFKHLLQSTYECEVLEFVGTQVGTDKEVYAWDIGQCIANCDIFIAILDLPSTGLGWELAVATARDIPVIGLAHQDAAISRLVTGATYHLPSFKIFRYQNLHIDALEQLEILLPKKISEE
jgi:nucleoside 2-deoxyribosyltransferase